VRERLGSGKQQNAHGKLVSDQISLAGRDRRQHEEHAMTLPIVNNLAVLACGVVIFMLGGLWYSPLLFAKRWVALIGKTEEELKANAGSMPASYLYVFLCGLVTAWLLAIVVGNFAPSSAVDGALIGALCWLGFAGATSFGSALFSGKPKALWLIDSGFNLVSFVVAGVILSTWR
jgi:hypothetical protein